MDWNSLIQVGRRFPEHWNPQVVAQRERANGCHPAGQGRPKCRQDQVQ
jgi:hypothetical protein